MSAELDFRIQGLVNIKGTNIVENIKSIDMLLSSYAQFKQRATVANNNMVKRIRALEAKVDLYEKQIVANVDGPDPDVLVG